MSNEYAEGDLSADALGALVANAPQRTPEWHAERRGKITASRVWCILPGKRGGYPAERQKYLYGIAAERLGVILPERYETDDMRRGRELEPVAREAMAFELGCTIREVGFIGNDVFGASLDGIAELQPAASIELKCPQAIEFVRFALGGEIDPDHYAQIQLGMLATGLTVAYLGYYHPEFPRPLVARRIERDTEFCARLEAEINKAEAEICEIVRKLS